MRFAPILLLALTGCEERHEAENVDSVICVRDAGDQLEIELSHWCVSSSQYDQSFTCEATAFGADNIEVSSVFAYTTKGNAQTADCGLVTTTCTVPLPEDGVYSVSHGDQVMSVSLVDGAVVLPDGDDAACSGEPFI